MSNKAEIRRSSPSDNEAIIAIYPAAFPDEDLLPLLHELLNDHQHVISLVAIHDATLIGHIATTTCTIEGRDEQAALLGPLAVTPDFQNQGIGSTLINECLRHLRNNAIAQALVLGDPAYYTRFGFNPETKVTPPYDLPPEWDTAWQSVNLHNTKPVLVGKLKVPKHWQQPALWLP